MSVINNRPEKKRDPSDAQVPPPRIVYDVQWPWMSIFPASPELESQFQSSQLVAQEDAGHGYSLRKRQFNLLQPGAPNTGLGLVAAYALFLQGHTVELPVPEQRLAELHGPACPDGNPHVIQLIQQYFHGMLRHDLPATDVAQLCSEIAATLPEARIAFAVATYADAETLHASLTARGERATLSYPSRCWEPGARLIVATYFGLGHPEVLSDPIDLLIFPDAISAISENGQSPVLGNGRARRVGFLRRDRSLPPRTRDLMMAMFGPCEATVPSLGEQDRSVEVAWMRVDSPVVPDHLSAYGSYRGGIERHPVRNRRIAHLAGALVTGDMHTVRRLCPDFRGGNSLAPSATAIVVGSVEHGLELAKRLPDWPFLVANRVNLDRLGLEQLRIFHHARSQSNQGRAIVTVPALREIDFNVFDVVIWAAGGAGLPDVPREQLVCRATEQRPLVLFDIRDGQHGELRRKSGSRQRAYTAAGWFPVGQSPLVGRIRRFLAQRPRGQA